MSATEAFFVARTLQALEVLAFEPRSAPQVAGALQVHPRTARRLLNRLVTDGWLRRTDGARPLYSPTMRIVALAAQLAERAPVVHHGVGVARTLHAESGLPVHLVVPSYRSALRLLRVTAAEGCTPRRDLAPAHATAGGKLLLAYREPWRRSLLEAALEPITGQTLVAPERVEAEAERTRARGYALEDGEYVRGVRAVAAPVRDGFGDVVAALGTSGPAAELRELDAVATRVSRAAAALSAQLGAAAA
jgi:DNA-binding IclR family transcriptional regulator